MLKRRGAAAAAENLQWLEELIQAHEDVGEILPTRAGALSHMEILKQVGPQGVGRHVLQDNPGFQQRLRDYAAKHGLRYSVKDDGDANVMDDGEKDRRIRQLETKNAELIAQIAALKIELRQALARDTEIIPDGKRVDLLPRYDRSFLDA